MSPASPVVKLRRKGIPGTKGTAFIVCLRRGLPSMSVTKVKKAVVALLGCAILGSGAGMFTCAAAAPAPAVMKPAADSNDTAVARDEASTAAVEALQRAVDF